tara:strand:+ start:274 stop:546 length:273 start_codon:yes stop_codon:yes gene_type:complete
MENKTFTFYADAGHAWLKVTLVEAKRLGLKLSDFSTYSYYRNCKREIALYLEEDLDAEVFQESYRAKYGKLPKIRESHCDYSSIRYLNHL